MLTSEQASKVRGVSLASGAKAILLKVTLPQNKLKYVLAVMSAIEKISWKDMKQLLNSKKVEFAAEAEVKSLVRCLPGAVPPFGQVFQLETLVDRSLITQGDTINFNCGLRTHSMKISVKDYIAAENPKVCSFTASSLSTQSQK